MKTQKKILIHVHTPLFPTNTGDRRRLLGILEYFQKRKEFFLVDAVSNHSYAFNSCMWTSKQKQEVLGVVDNFFMYQGNKNLFDFFYSRSQSFYYQKLLRQQLPVDSEYFTPPGYINFIRSLISQRGYDFIWINYIEFAHLAIKSKTKEVNTLLDMHDLSCESRLVKKNLPPYNGLKFDYEANLAREVKLLNKFDTVIPNSKKELQVLNEYLPSSKLYLIPHIVERSSKAYNLISYSQRNFEYDLLFVGSAYKPNLDGLNFFLESILPKVIYKKPDTRLAIAGKVSECVQLIPSLKGNVNCLGYVSDLSELYLKSRVVICPLLDGAGTKVKLQEAMAYAMPIVTTTAGASGLSFIDGFNAFVTDEPHLYAHQILCLLEEPELAQKFSEEIAETFEREYSISAVYSKLDQMFGISTSQS